MAASQTEWLKSPCPPARYSLKSALPKIILVCLASLVAIASGAVPARRAKANLTSDDDLIIGARAIVVGRVLSLACRLDADEDRVYTYVTVDVEETIKGEISDRQIVVKEEGGEVDGQGSIIFGAPQFKRGERVLLYLDTRADGSLRVHQLSFGKLTIIEDGTSGEPIIQRDTVCAAVINPTMLHSSRRSLNQQMTLTDYRQMVQARLAANWQRAQAFEAAHYAAVPMRAQPVEYDRALHRGEMRPLFTLLYPLKSVRWFEPDSNQPVVFYINPDAAPNPQVLDDVGAAMNAWMNIAGCKLRLVNGGARNACPTERTVSVITFNNCDQRFSPSAEQGRIIALGGLKWTSEETRQVNGQTFVKAAYGFVSFNPYTSDSYNNHCDLREAATHELGHALGLGHSQYPEATMNGAAHFDGRCASLTDDDRNGIAFIYPVNDLGSRPLAIESDSLLSDAVKDIRYSQPIRSSGGVLPHTWTHVPGYGRLPSGLALNSGGIITGVPIETGTFTFKAQVEDGVGNLLQKSFTVTVREPLPFDSRFVSQSVVSTVQVGQTLSATLKWLNVGSQMWDGGTVKLVSQNPNGNDTWRVTAMAVPGITLKGDQLTVPLTLTAPRVAGTYNFQWQLAQTSGAVFGQPSANLQIIVTPGPPAIDAASTLQAVAGTPFIYQLTVTGGTPPFIWSITSGALPAGLNLNSQSGLIAGTPTAAGNAIFTAQVTDALSRAAQRSFSLAVAPPAASPLTLNLAATLQAVKGQPFAYQPQAAGGTPPYVWSITGGALPGEFVLNGVTGQLTGTPANAGEFSVTITVRDQRNESASATTRITVTEPLPTPVISKAKYKAGKRKLIVTGERIDANAALFVDGAQVAAQVETNTITIKPISLNPGAHELRIVNPGGTASPSYQLIVE
jgi:hypothetical protein